MLHDTYQTFVINLLLNAKLSKNFIITSQTGFIAVCSLEKNSDFLLTFSLQNVKYKQFCFLKVFTFNSFTLNF